MKNIVVEDLGSIQYKKAWDYQTELFEEIIAQKLENREAEKLGNEIILPDNHLLYCEHNHVYTLGKSGDENHVLLSPKEREEKSIEFFPINRGGDITYHGPGQMVVYPILDLDQFFTDIHKYLRFLEEAIIKVMAHYGLKGDRYPGYTGVWLDPEDPVKARKICAMGIKCSRWVTMHGLAFNVNTDLKYFDYIIPCGIKDKAVTSLEAELGSKVDMEEVKKLFHSAFNELFEIN